MQRSSWHHLDQTYYTAKEFSLNQKENNKKKKNFEGGLFLWSFSFAVEQECIITVSDVLWIYVEEIKVL